jgi:methyl-accepting chemotaxis protein WspA
MSTLDSVRNLKISTRLALLVGLFSVTFGAFAWVTFDTVARVKVNGPEYAKIALGKDLVADVLPPPEYIIESYLAALQMQQETDRATLLQLSQRGRVLRDEFEERHRYWDHELGDGPLKQALISRAYRPAIEFLDIRDREYVPAILGGNAARAAELARGPLREKYEEHRAGIDEVVRLATKQNEEREKAVGELLDRSLGWLKALTGGVALLLVLLAVMTQRLARSIAERVGIVAAAAQRVADGDLTVTLAPMGQDEVGQMAEAVRQMTDRMGSLVGQVKRSSIDLLSTATEIAATSSEHDAAMTGLGASTTEVAAAVKQISTTGQELVLTMGQLSTLATGASTKATEGRTALSAMETTMNGLALATTSISEKLATIRERAGDINGVVTTITKVADQTNLLSVNAAIEAEKAGEYGRGFLVLAREIRRLADQTAVATLDIERLVRTMQSAVNAGVMEMESFSEEMRAGKRRVADVGEQLSLVIEQVQGVLMNFGHVSEGMRNQSEGAKQISSAMAQVNETARQTAASLREFNTATAQMRDAVDLLKIEIARYRVQALAVLVLVVSAGGERYALPSRCVVEVVPRVPPRPIALSPGWVSGVIRYRGALLPVLDLVMLLTGKAASNALSTRMLVVRYESEGEPHLLGILAELVTSVVEVDESTAYRGLRLENAPFLGELIASDGKIIQIVRPEHLLPGSIRELLFAVPS